MRLWKYSRSLTPPRIHNVPVPFALPLLQVALLFRQLCSFLVNKSLHSIHPARNVRNTVRKHSQNLRCEFLKLRFWQRRTCQDMVEGIRLNINIGSRGWSIHERLHKSSMVRNLLTVVVRLPLNGEKSTGFELSRRRRAVKSSGHGPSNI